MSDRATFFVAIVGCVTGVASLLINFYKILVERPKLRVVSVKPHLNGFSSTVSGYNSDHPLLLNLRLSNIGRFQLSVSQIYLVNKGRVIRFYQEAPLPNINYQIDEHTRSSYQLYGKVRLPLLLEIGAVCTASFVFPFSDSLYESSKRTKNYQVHLRVVAGDRTISARIPVHELLPENIQNYVRSHKNCIEI